MSAVPNNPPVSDQVNIEIDGVAMAAPKGSMIIQAADKAGIAIPRFCYHEKLPIAANCRMCLVDVEKMPKPAPACATPVMEGMKITTRTKRALDAQRNVMEFLLINHPLDCPICDQGGECELQDVAMGYGRSVSRFNERKRVVADEDLGPLVATEMTRCIHCTRCVRFTAEIAGTYELGGMYRGENLEIGTYDGKPLMSELSGNVIDVCPVGALTNKVFRFKARAWELIARESIAVHDALGSNLFLHQHRGQVVRTVPRDNEAVNECWLSDRDRYSHQGLYAEDRLSQPMIKENGQWRQASWEQALAAAKTAITGVAADELGILVHPATSNEEGALLARLATGLNCSNIDHRLAQLDFADAPVAEPFGMPVAELGSTNVVLLVGSNIRHELPLVHQRLHQANKRGTKIFAINPIDFDWTFSCTGKVLAAPSQLPGLLAGVAEVAGANLPAGISIEKHDGLAAIAEALKTASNAVVMIGEIAENHVAASHLRAAARALCATTGAKLNRIPQGANAVGLAAQHVIPQGTGLNTATMLAQPRKAYVTYGIEPALDFADGAAAHKALASAHVIAFSAYASEALKAVADVLLPIALTPEIEASYTNLDGRVQLTQAGAKTPGEARPGWRVLRAFGEQLGIAGFDFIELSQLRSSLTATLPSSGAGLAKIEKASGLERITTTPIYRGDAVLRRAISLNQHPLTAGARIVMHPEEALARGLSVGSVAKVTDGVGTATLPVAIDLRVVKGAVWIERGYEASAPLSPTASLSISKVSA